MSSSGGGSADVTDRAARLLGVADVSDRAARLIGQGRIQDGAAAALASVMAATGSGLVPANLGNGTELVVFADTYLRRASDATVRDAIMAAAFAGADMADPVLGLVAEAPFLWNPATLSNARMRTGDATSLALTRSSIALLTALVGHWSVVHAPAANVVATATKAAAAGVRHVCTGIYASLVAGAVAPAAVAGNVVVRDGATGVGAIIWQQPISVQAIAGDRDNIEISNENIVGTAGNAMTIEFLAAGGANTLEAVTLTGYDAT